MLLLFPGIVQEIDMFKEVGLLDKPLPQGVTSTQGQNSNSRAFHFTTQAQNLLANPNAFNNADTLIHDSQDFWVSAWVKLDTNNPNDNTILSISSADGNDLYFKLKISWVKLKWTRPLTFPSLRASSPFFVERSEKRENVLAALSRAGLARPLATPLNGELARRL